MKLIDLPAEFAVLRDDILSAMQRVIDRGVFILGPEGQALEAEIAELCQVRFAVGLNSGTDALSLSLRGLGIQPGDEVITSPFTFVATAEIAAALGAKPVFVDIDSTLNIDPSKIEAAITPQTKAIITVDLYGLPADYDAIRPIAERHNLAVIEDAAQAIGASYFGRPAGSLGQCGCFSFFPTKNLGAYGDAGMVVTNDEQLANWIRLARNHGAPRKYYHEFIAVSSRLDELQAAILRAKLPHLKTWNDQRRANAAIYTKALRGIPGIIAVPSEPVGCRSVYHQYTLRVVNRDQLIRHLQAADIPASIHYPVPLHLQPAFRYLGYEPNQFPEAENASREVVSIPCHTQLSLEDIGQVIEAIRSFYE